MKAFAIVALLATLVGSSAAFSTNHHQQTKNVVARKATRSDTTGGMSYNWVNEVDETSSFSIPADKLLERAKEVLSPTVSLGTKDGGDCLADDFEFCAAVVGPIGREEYLGALGSFRLEDAFDITTNYYGLSVDPLQPNRVWFFTRLQGIHKGTFMGAEPTGKEVVYPPQINHIDFNEDGKIKEYGFYTADRRQGNTGGLGGAFGFMYAVGKSPPIPEFQPYKRSFRFRMAIALGSLGRMFKRNKEAKEDHHTLSFKEKEASTKED